jgi:hypothetical protein
LQQTVGFLQTSPTLRHALIIFGAGISPQRPIMQVPEQHSGVEAQRSCVGRQPGAQSQRLTPFGPGSQRPEQQSMGILQISRAGWQAGSAWHFVWPIPPH